MAFPVVATTNVTADTDGSSTAVNMPSGITAGDLLLVFVAHDSSTVVSQSGGSDWSRLEGQSIVSGAVSHAIFAKIAAGGDTLTITGAAQDTTCISVRITGHGVSNVTTDITRGTLATGTSAAPDPPNCNPGVAADYLWLECFFADDDDDTTNYETAGGAYTKVAQNQSANSTSSVLVAVASRNLNASSLDPAAMALAASEEWGAQTLAIPPVAAQNYTGDVNEEVTLSESVAGAAGLISAASEDVGAVGESLADSYQAIAATPETVSFSESLDSLFAGIAALDEEPGYSESLQAGQELTGDVAEDVGAVGESLAGSYQAIAALDEEPALSESLAGFRATTGDATEDVGAIDEALAGTYAGVVGLAEEPALSESLASLYAATGQITEDVGAVGESLASQLAAIVAIDEGPALSESLDSIRDAFVALAEGSALAEDVTGEQGTSGANYSANVNENVALAEALASVFVGAAALVESLSVTESVSGAVEGQSTIIEIIVALAASTVEHAVAAPSVAVEVDELFAIAHSYEWQEEQMIAGNRLRLSASFRDVDGVAFDPTTPSLTVRAPSGAEEVFTEGDGLTAEGEGAFSAEYVTAEEGLHRYRWESNAVGEEAAEEGTFTVSVSRL